jgi:hypothetical protein
MADFNWAKQGITNIKSYFKQKGDGLTEFIEEVCGNSPSVNRDWTFMDILFIGYFTVSQVNTEHEANMSFQVSKELL